VVGTPTDTADPHWQGGVDYIPDSCAEAGTTLDGCPSGDTVTKAPTVTGIGDMGAQPFTVFSWIRCSPVGFSQAEVEARARNGLTRGEARAVERIFWTGTTSIGAQDVLPHLAENTAVTEAGIQLQTAATIITGTTVDVVEGMGMLEGELALCYGGEGVIHVPRSLLAALAGQGLVRQDGMRLRTMGGMNVAAYSSNNRQGPDGTNPAGGTTWIYGTGAVDMRRSDIEFTGSYAQSIDRSENSLVLVAERTYVIGWDCCHLAVRVSLGGEVTGAIGSPS
jgi:hypothetical protein